jgi:magnesium transporter
VLHAFVLDGETLTETESLADVEKAHAAGKTYWLDLGPESKEKEKFLLDVLHVHPLVVEDIWLERSLPKVEDFGSYLYILVHGTARGAKASEIELVELDVILGPNFVITHHEKCMSVAAVRDELRRSARMFKKGPAWVVHSLLDHLVDHYTPLLDEMDEEIADLEDKVLAYAGTHREKGLMARILSFKRGLMKLRRISSHQRDILLRLSRAEFDEIPTEAVPFYRDVYDHFARVTDLADGYRELVAGVMEAYLSVQSNRMNEVMKRLTIISTIMMPLTFIAGVYGMNFQVMPELGWKYGYPFAIGLMIAVAIGVVGYFKAKHWL